MTFRYRGIEMPQHYATQLKAWADSGKHPEPFLASVLENNLYGTVTIAMSQDGPEFDLLPVVIAYCYNELPGGCWGTPQRVAAWAEKFHPAEGIGDSVWSKRKTQEKQ